MEKKSVYMFNSISIEFADQMFVLGYGIVCWRFTFSIKLNFNMRIFSQSSPKLLELRSPTKKSTSLLVFLFIAVQSHIFFSLCMFRQVLKYLLAYFLWDILDLRS